MHFNIISLSIRARCFICSVGFWSKALEHTFSGPWGTAVALSHEYLTTHQRIVSRVKCKRGCTHNYRGGGGVCPLILQALYVPSRAPLPSALVNYWPWLTCMLMSFCLISSLIMPSCHQMAMRSLWETMVTEQWDIFLYIFCWYVQDFTQVCTSNRLTFRRAVAGFKTSGGSRKVSFVVSSFASLSSFLCVVVLSLFLVILSLFLVILVVFVVIWSLCWVVLCLSVAILSLIVVVFLFVVVLSLVFGSLCFLGSL